jgi:hypothetical protein
VKIIRKKSERLYILVLHVQPVIESTMLGVCVIDQCVFAQPD